MAKATPMPTFVGIDLGTTNSAVAYRNAYGRPEVIANREGQNITPSVIYFGADPPVVGQEAKEWARLGNEEIASFFKPHMGNPLFQLRFHEQDLLGHGSVDVRVAPAQGRRRVPAGRPGRSRRHHRAGLFRRCPAQGHHRRPARPPASRSCGSSTSPPPPRSLMGCKSGRRRDRVDLRPGGGTFDVTVARITPDEIVVLSTAGDHDLGGKNWDDRIATFLAETVRRRDRFRPA